MSTVASICVESFSQRDVLSARAPKPALDHSAILSIGRDLLLLSSRAAVLRTSGRPVHSATPEQVHLLHAGMDINLVVLGHTLADAEVIDLADYFRCTTPSAKLMLTCFYPRPRAVHALVDGSVSSTDGPAVLVQTVCRLLTEPTVSRPFQA